jgi:hypothetical protein
MAIHNKLKSMNFLVNTDFKKNPFYILLIVSSFLLLFATCKKNRSECIGNSYSLREKWNIYSQKDSINIGDTLIFSSLFSNHPFDYNSNVNVDFSGGALVGTPFDLRIVKGFNDLRPAIDSFSFFLLDGRYKDNDLKPNQIKDIFWLESNNNYSIKIRLIANKKGDYVFTLPDAIGKLSKVNDCQSGAGIFLTNNNSKNNAYLLLPYYSLPAVPSNDSAHIFCIRVK